MSFRIQRRLNYGSGLGLNLSKSGASPSLRTRFGSIGAKGFSIRTGIKGLYFRQSWGKGSDGAITGMMVMVAFGFFKFIFFITTIMLKTAFYLGWLLLALSYNIAIWTILTSYDFIKYLLTKNE
jgi:hypothetical protein